MLDCCMYIYLSTVRFLYFSTINLEMFTEEASALGVLNHKFSSPQETIDIFKLPTFGKKQKLCMYTYEQ